MKFFTILSLLLTLSNVKAEVIETESMISVVGLNCIVRVGMPGPIEERTYTSLTGYDRGPIGIVQHQEDVIELNHKSAIASGCDLESLDKISEEARQSFSYRRSKIKVSKTSSVPELNGSGKCISLFKENLEIDLGHGVILNSNEAVLREVTGC